MSDKTRKKYNGGRKPPSTDSDLANGPPRQRPVITVDYERYAHFLEDADLTEEQKQQFLESLWRIIVSFVDLGFGVHPVQQAQQACGELEDDPSNSSSRAADKVTCESRLLTDRFDDVADPEPDVVADGVEI